MTMTTKPSPWPRTLLLTGAVLLAGQAMAAAGGKNSGDNPGASHRQSGNQQHMMEDEEYRNNQAGQMREHGEDARANGERDMEHRGDHDDEDMDERHEDMMDEHHEDMMGEHGRPEGAGPEVNPGERGSDQGQASKQEHSKAWWNFWD